MEAVKENARQSSQKQKILKQNFRSANKHGTPEIPREAEAGGDREGGSSWGKLEQKKGPLGVETAQAVRV